MPRVRVHADGAARVKAYRDRHSLKQMSVEIPADVLAQFEEFLKFKDLSKSEVVTKLIVSQLLRKR